MPAGQRQCASPAIQVSLKSLILVPAKPLFSAPLAAKCSSGAADSGQSAKSRSGRQHGFVRRQHIWPGANAIRADTPAGAVEHPGARGAHHGRSGPAGVSNSRPTQITDCSAVPLDRLQPRCHSKPSAYSSPRHSARASTFSRRFQVFDRPAPVTGPGAARRRCHALISARAAPLWASCPCRWAAARLQRHSRADPPRVASASMPPRPATRRSPPPARPANSASGQRRRRHQSCCSRAGCQPGQRRAIQQAQGAKLNPSLP